MATADSAETVAEYVLKGGEFRKLKDASGNALTDRRLLELAAPIHPWLDDVYSATSGWVHFSPEHVRAAWQAKEDEGGLTLSGGIPLRPEQIPASALRELLGAMIKATEELFGYAEIWESRKDLPPGQERRARLAPVGRVQFSGRNGLPLDGSQKPGLRPITRCYEDGFRRRL
jgi:hypothetical protein